jgi:hypothetical protein
MFFTHSPTPKPKRHVVADQQVANVLRHHWLASSPSVASQLPPPIQPPPRGIQLANVYQPTYNYQSRTSTGLGDFLRGCFCLLEYCEQWKLPPPRIVFHHPIHAWLLHQQHMVDTHPDRQLWDHVQNCEEINIKEFVVDDHTHHIHYQTAHAPHVFYNAFAQFLQTEQTRFHMLTRSPGKTSGGCTYIHTTAYPQYNHHPPPHHAKYMRDMLTPSPAMSDALHQRMRDLSIQPHRYHVFHIRSGDTYLLSSTESNAPSTPTLPKLHILLDFLLRDWKRVTRCGSGGSGCSSGGGGNDQKESTHTPVSVLISDNNVLKTWILDQLPQCAFRVWDAPIAHMGEGTTPTPNQVLNTLLDFYLMSQSASIHSYSAMRHGTGFSEWCAHIHHVPYTCTHWDNK